MLRCSSKSNLLRSTVTQFDVIDADAEVVDEALLARPAGARDDAEDDESGEPQKPLARHRSSTIKLPPGGAAALRARRRRSAWKGCSPPCVPT